MESPNEKLWRLARERGERRCALEAKELEKEKKLNKDLQKYLNNTKLKNLLLNGLPESNGFKINRETANRFIRNQQTSRKKKAAEALIKTNKYITHREFIALFRKLVEKFFNDINLKQNKDYIILSEKTHKSGFFCTMIFLFLVKEGMSSGKNYWLPKYIYPSWCIDTIFNKYKNTNINFIQINDTDYSANQSDSIRSTICRWISRSNMNEAEKQQFLRKLSNNFYILRVLTNSYAKNKLTTPYFSVGGSVCPAPGLRIKYIYGKELPTLKEKIAEMYSNDNTNQLHSDIIRFFGGCSNDGVGSIMNIYLDHKISDYPSTTALALTLGIVPNNSAYRDIDPCSAFRRAPIQREIPRAGENINNPQQLVIPLIENCKYKIIDEIYFKGKPKGNYDDMRELIEDNQIIRCPYAWYKKINYDTGEVDLSLTRIFTIQDEMRNRVMNQRLSDGSYQMSRSVGGILHHGGRKKYRRHRKRKTKRRRRKTKRHRRKTKRRKRKY